MPPGKLASQAGHAFLDAFVTASRDSPAIAHEYKSDNHGTKVVLIAPSEDHIRFAHEEAQRLGIPSALIIDSGHIMPPHFTGEPIITALGIGPARRSEIKQITKRFKLAT
jgi:peptidyl-tRNA hydrolase, PTH2 family